MQSQLQHAFFQVFLLKTYQGPAINFPTSLMGQPYFSNLLARKTTSLCTYSTEITTSSFTHSLGSLQLLPPCFVYVSPALGSSLYCAETLVCSHLLVSLTGSEQASAFGVCHCIASVWEQCTSSYPCHIQQRVLVLGPDVVSCTDSILSSSLTRSLSKLANIR